MILLVLLMLFNINMFSGDITNNTSIDKEIGDSLEIELIIKKEYIVEKTQYGIVSFYGKTHHNRKTASGERFDMYKLTAAHKKLPFGTLVRVTNLYDSSSVIVKINDRGPYIKGRVLDISKAAADKINNTGILKCKIEILKEINIFKINKKEI